MDDVHIASHKSSFEKKFQFTEKIVGLSEVKGGGETRKGGEDTKMTNELQKVGKKEENLCKILWNSPLKKGQNAKKSDINHAS